MATPKPVSPAAPQPATLPPLAGIVLALVAAALAYGAVAAVHPLYRVGPEFDVPSIGAPTELFLANRREQDKVERRHAMIYIGGLGLVLAAALAAGEGALQRVWLAPLVAAPVGALGGALGGWLGSLAQVYVRTNVGQAELSHTIGTQLALGLPLGLGIGLGVGLGVKLWTHGLAGAAQSGLAGLAAGGLAAALYPVLVSIILPAASTESLLPDETNSRLLWYGVYSGIIGMIVSLAGSRKNVRLPVPNH